MSNTEIILFIFILTASVQLTRMLPFLLFRNDDTMPPIISYLGNSLPAAVMGLLCIYCFKDYDYSSFTDVWPALFSSVVVISVHFLKKNAMVSIALGTMAYMLLIRIF